MRSLAVAWLLLAALTVARAQETQPPVPSSADSEPPFSSPPFTSAPETLPPVPSSAVPTPSFSSPPSAETLAPETGPPVPIPSFSSPPFETDRPSFCEAVTPGPDTCDNVQHSFGPCATVNECVAATEDAKCFHATEAECTSATNAKYCQWIPMPSAAEPGRCHSFAQDRCNYLSDRGCQWIVDGVNVCAVQAMCTTNYAFGVPPSVDQDPCFAASIDPSVACESVPGCESSGGSCEFQFGSTTPSCRVMTEAGSCGALGCIWKTSEDGSFLGYCQDPMEATCLSAQTTEACSSMVNAEGEPVCMAQTQCTRTVDRCPEGSDECCAPTTSETCLSKDTCSWKVRCVPATAQSCIMLSADACAATDGCVLREGGVCDTDAIAWAKCENLGSNGECASDSSCMSEERGRCEVDREKQDCERRIAEGDSCCLHNGDSNACEEASGCAEDSWCEPIGFDNCHEFSDEQSCVTNSLAACLWQGESNYCKSATRDMCENAYDCNDVKDDSGKELCRSKSECRNKCNGDDECCPNPDQASCDAAGCSFETQCEPKRDPKCWRHRSADDCNADTDRKCMWRAYDSDTNPKFRQLGPDPGGECDSQMWPYCDFMGSVGDCASASDCELVSECHDGHDKEPMPPTCADAPDGPGPCCWRYAHEHSDPDGCAADEACEVMERCVSTVWSPCGFYTDAASCGGDQTNQCQWIAQGDYCVSTSESVCNALSGELKTIADACSGDDCTVRTECVPAGEGGGEHDKCEDDPVCCPLDSEATCSGESGCSWMPSCEPKEEFLSLCGQLASEEECNAQSANFCYWDSWDSSGEPFDDRDEKNRRQTGGSCINDLWRMCKWHNSENGQGSGDIEEACLSVKGANGDSVCTVLGDCSANYIGIPGDDATCGMYDFSACYSRRQLEERNATGPTPPRDTSARLKVAGASARAATRLVKKLARPSFLPPHLTTTPGTSSGAPRGSFADFRDAARALLQALPSPTPSKPPSNNGIGSGRGSGSGSGSGSGRGSGSECDGAVPLPGNQCCGISSAADCDADADCRSSFFCQPTQAPTCHRYNDAAGCNGASECEWGGGGWCEPKCINIMDKAECEAEGACRAVTECRPMSEFCPDPEDKCCRAGDSEADCNGVGHCAFNPFCETAPNADENSGCGSFNEAECLASNLCWLDRTSATCYPDVGSLCRFYGELEDCSGAPKDASGNALCVLGGGCVNASNHGGGFRTPECSKTDEASCEAETSCDWDTKCVSTVFARCWAHNDGGSCDAAPGCSWRAEGRTDAEGYCANTAEDECQNLEGSEDACNASPNCMYWQRCIDVSYRCGDDTMCCPSDTMEQCSSHGDKCSPWGYCSAAESGLPDCEALTMDECNAALADGCFWNDWGECENARNEICGCKGSARGPLGQGRGSEVDPAKCASIMAGDGVTPLCRTEFNCYINYDMASAGNETRPATAGTATAGGNRKLLQSSANDGSGRPTTGPGSASGSASGSGSGSGSGGEVWCYVQQTEAECSAVGDNACMWNGYCESDVCSLCRKYGDQQERCSADPACEFVNGYCRDSRSKLCESNMGPDECNAVTDGSGNHVCAYWASCGDNYCGDDKCCGPNVGDESSCEAASDACAWNTVCRSKREEPCFSKNTTDDCTNAGCVWQPYEAVVADDMPAGAGDPNTRQRRGLLPSRAFEAANRSRRITGGYPRDFRHAARQLLQSANEPDQDKGSGSGYCYNPQESLCGTYGRIGLCGEPKDESGTALCEEVGEAGWCSNEGEGEGSHCERGDKCCASDEDSCSAAGESCSWTSNCDIIISMCWFNSGDKEACESAGSSCVYYDMLGGMCGDTNQEMCAAASGDRAACESVVDDAGTRICTTNDFCEDKLEECEDRRGQEKRCCEAGAAKTCDSAEGCLTFPACESVTPVYDPESPGALCYRINDPERCESEKGDDGKFLCKVIDECRVDECGDDDCCKIASASECAFDDQCAYQHYCQPIFDPCWMFRSPSDCPSDTCFWRVDNDDEGDPAARRLLSAAAAARRQAGREGRAFPEMPWSRHLLQEEGGGTCLSLMDGSSPVGSCYLADAVACRASSECVSGGQCMDRCGQCDSCMRDVTGLVGVQMSSGLSLEDSAAQLLETCYEGLDNEMCEVAGAAFEEDPTIVRRPSAICTVVDMCTDECLADGSFDLCEGYIPPFTLPEDSSYCRKNSDCSDGEKCSASAATDECVRVCECNPANGKERCTACLGKCTPKCAAAEAADAKAEGEAKCDADADCSGGLLCSASNACRKCSCDATTGITTCEKCAGFCRDPVAQVKGAQFNADGTAILVALSEPAAEGIFPCADIFDEASAAILGGLRAVCQVRGSGMRVLLGAGATVTPGSPLQLIASSALVEADTGSPFASGSGVDVMAPDVPLPPLVIIAGPATVGTTCPGDAGDVDTVNLDGSLTIDPTGRGLAFTWSLAATPSDPDAATYAASVVGDQGDQGTIAMMVSEIPVGTYEFKLEAVTFLGAANTATFTLDKLADSVPQVQISGGSVQQFTPATGIRIGARLDPSSICPGQTSAVQYLWTAVSTEGGEPLVLDEAAAARRTLVVSPGGLTVGLHTLRLDVQLPESGVSSSRVLANVTHSALVAAIAGGGGSVLDNEPLVLSGEGSHDPDVAGGMRFAWECIRTDGNVCFEGTSYSPETSSPTLNIAPDALCCKAGETGADGKCPCLEAGMTYVFVLTIGDATREASARAAVRVVSGGVNGSPPLPYISRMCRGGCSVQHNPGDPIRLNATLRSSRDGARVTYQWSSADSNGIALEPPALLGTATGPYLAISNAALKGGKEYTFSVVATDAELCASSPDTCTGDANITIATNRPPVCDAEPTPEQTAAKVSPCVAVEPAEGTAGSTTFTISARNWVDETAVAFSYLYLSSDGTQVVLSAGTADRDFATQLPAGDPDDGNRVMVQACATDTLGARACGGFWVVSAPSTRSTEQEAANLEESLDKAIQTGDNTALVTSILGSASNLNTDTGANEAAAAARRKSAEALRDITVSQSSANVLGVVSALAEVTKVPDQVGEDTAMVAMETLNFLTAKLGDGDNGIVVDTGVANSFLDSYANAVVALSDSGDRADAGAAAAGGGTSFEDLRSSLDALAKSLSRDNGGTVGEAAASSSSADGRMQMLTSTESAASANGKTYGFTTPSRRRRALLAEAAAGGSLALPAGFADACAVSASCPDTFGTQLLYLQTPEMLMASLEGGPSSGAEVVTGALSVALTDPTTGEAFATSIEFAGVFTITLELLDPASDGGKDIVCRRYIPDTQSLTGVGVTTVGVAGGEVTCEGSYMGQYLAIIKPEAREASPIPAPKPTTVPTADDGKDTPLAPSGGDSPVATSAPTPAPTTPAPTPAPTAAVAIPTPAPTPAPTTVSHYVHASITLEGYTQEEFGAAEEAILAGFIASKMGIEASRVSIDSVGPPEVGARRLLQTTSLLVKFSVATGSLEEANSLGQPLTTALFDTAAFAAGARMAGLSKVSGATVVELPYVGDATAAPTPAPTAVETSESARALPCMLAAIAGLMWLGLA